jgi:hypothetical protein
MHAECRLNINVVEMEPEGGCPAEQWLNKTEENDDTPMRSKMFLYAVVALFL